MCKSGISTLTPKLETDCIVNLIFTVIGREGSQYKVISSRFWQGCMTEEKLKTLYELGAVNGIEVDSKGKITLCVEKRKQTQVVENKTSRKTDTTQSEDQRTEA